MARATFVSEERYLRTRYEPAADFVDGVVVKRNAGEFPHSATMGEISYWVASHCQGLGLRALVALRMKIRPGRYRVLDVAIQCGSREQAPLVAVEVLSPADRMMTIQERIDDYLAMGTPFVWVIDPETRRAWVYREGSIEECKDGNLKAGPPDFVLPLGEIFSAIDAMTE